MIAWEVGLMNKWQKQFSEKVDVIRIASWDRFEQIAIEDIMPVFDEFSEFTRTRGLQAMAPAPTNGMRTFKFAITENAYVLMTFRLSGLESCEANAEFCIPKGKKTEDLRDRAEMADVDPQWTRQFFENALDQFMDAYLESLGTKPGAERELVTA